MYRIRPKILSFKRIGLGKNRDHFYKLNFTLLGHLYPNLGLKPLFSKSANLLKQDQENFCQLSSLGTYGNSESTFIRLTPQGVHLYPNLGIKSPRSNPPTSPTLGLGKNNPRQPQDQENLGQCPYLLNEKPQNKSETTFISRTLPYQVTHTLT